MLGWLTHLGTHNREPAASGCDAGPRLWRVRIWQLLTALRLEPEDPGQIPTLPPTGWTAYGEPLSISVLQAPELSLHLPPARVFGRIK